MDELYNGNSSKLSFYNSSCFSMAYKAPSFQYLQVLHHIQKRRYLNFQISPYLMFWVLLVMFYFP